MNQSKVFNIDKKYCFKVSLVYFATVLLANLMAQVIPVCMDFTVLLTDDMLKWKAFLDSNEILVNIITFSVFLIPSIISLSYSFSILFANLGVSVV